MIQIKKDPFVFGFVVFLATFLASVFTQFIVVRNSNVIQALSTSLTLGVVIGLLVQFRNNHVRRKFMV